MTASDDDPRDDPLGPRPVGAHLPERSGLNVLWLDDDAVVDGAETQRRALESTGATVHFITYDLELSQQLRNLTHAADVCIVDMRLGGPKTPGLVRTLKQELSSIPIVLVGSGPGTHPDHVAASLDAGAADFLEAPMAAREFAARLRARVSQRTVGLTLTFDTRLHRFDPTAFDIFIGEVVGPDTDVTIEERSNIGDEGPGFIRINGSNPADLVAVAEAFYDRTWEHAVKAAEDAAVVKAMSSGFAMVLGRLSHQRDHLVEIKATVGILGNPDVREKLTDQGAAHVLEKDKKLLQTRFQRLTTGVADEVQRRTVGKLGKVVQGEVEDGVAGFLGVDDDDG